MCDHAAQRVWRLRPQRVLLPIADDLDALIVLTNLCTVVMFRNFVGTLAAKIQNQLWLFRRYARLELARLHFARTRPNVRQRFLFAERLRYGETIYSMRHSEERPEIGQDHTESILGFH